MRKALATMVAIACGLLVGCSNDTETADSEDAVTASPSVGVTESPSEEPLEVSEEAACLEAFPALQAAADIINEFAESPDGSTIDVEELRSTVRRLEHVREVAPDDMQGLLAEQINPLRELLEVFEGGPNRTIDTDNFRSAGIELATRCRPHI